MSKAFSSSHGEVASLPVRHGAIRDFSGSAHPSIVYGWERAALELSGGATHFGVVIDGIASVRTTHGRFDLTEGMYFCLPGKVVVQGGKGLVVSHLDYTGLLTLGGPIEKRGRLKYIDGCSDSVLVAPPVVGDPCLNLLYMPPYTDQTMHTHPSVRIGVILGGGGVCDTPKGPVPLEKGTMFVLPADAPHCFHTKATSLKICVYHPDTDVGPSQDDHPMLNRTLVGGISANQLPDIRPEIRD